MGAAQSGRVIVGVDGSLTSLRALRAAVAEARGRGTRLLVVHVRRPAHANVPIGVFGIPEPTPWPGQETVCSLDHQAEAVIARCIDEGLGIAPADVVISFRVEVGRPDAALVRQVCRDDDLLVVGTCGRSRWTHPFRRSVGSYCVGHAKCPVLVVPPDDFARAMRREHRWFRFRRTWKRFDLRASQSPPPIRRR
jgi:nucleotide-binding universal stress UspA family protein